MVIQQGDVYWVDLGEPKGRPVAYRHPCVVVQGNPFNQSHIRTVVVCAITSNVKRAVMPDSILLKKGEAGLSKDSVVLVSQLYTADRSFLSEQIGTLNADRMNEIIQGIKTVLDAE